MKFKITCIVVAELQEYLDKYQDKIKFIIPCIYLSNASHVMLIIDES